MNFNLNFVQFYRASKQLNFCIIIIIIIIIIIKKKPKKKKPLSVKNQNIKN